MHSLNPKGHLCKQILFMNGWLRGEVICTFVPLLAQKLNSYSKNICLYCIFLPITFLKEEVRVMNIQTPVAAYAVLPSLSQYNGSAYCLNYSTRSNVT